MSRDRAWRELGRREKRDCGRVDALDVGRAPRLEPGRWAVFLEGGLDSKLEDGLLG